MGVSVAVPFLAVLPLFPGTHPYLLSEEAVERLAYTGVLISENAV